jgi:hypothetical protein
MIFLLVWDLPSILIMLIFHLNIARNKLKDNPDLLLDKKSKDIMDEEAYFGEGINPSLRQTTQNSLTISSD